MAKVGKNIRIISYRLIGNVALYGGTYALLGRSTQINVTAK